MKPAWFPNTDADREAWEQAKAELGPSASVHAIAARAQSIKRAAQLTEEPEDEYERRQRG